MTAVMLTRSLVVLTVLVLMILLVTLVLRVVVRASSEGCDLLGRRLTVGEGPGLIAHQLLYSRGFLTYKKGEKASDTDMGRRTESALSIVLSMA